MRLQVRIANQCIGLFLRSGFRPSYSATFMRELFERTVGVSGEVLQKKYPGVTFRTECVGNIPIETVHPGKAVKRRILYCHGGGYFMGSIHSYRRNALRIAYRCEAEVTLFDYRLAPEHPFPAALDDAKAVYQYLQTKYSNERLVIGGDSAGGGLALATTIALREAGISLPAAVFCLSPWADLTGSTASYHSNATKDVWLSKNNTNAWAAWYAGTTDRRSPLISPLFADYRNFPPVFIAVGDQEVLHDEGKAVADRVMESGGKATFLAGKDMQHNWFFSLPFLPESKVALKQLANFLKTDT